MTQQVLVDDGRADPGAASRLRLIGGVPALGLRDTARRWSGPLLPLASDVANDLLQRSPLEIHAHLARPRAAQAPPAGAWSRDPGRSAPAGRSSGRGTQRPRPGSRPSTGARGSPRPRRCGRRVRTRRRAPHLAHRPARALDGKEVLDRGRHVDRPRVGEEQQAGMVHALRDEAGRVLLGIAVGVLEDAVRHAHGQGGHEAGRRQESRCARRARRARVAWNPPPLVPVTAIFAPSTSGRVKR